MISASVGLALEDRKAKFLHFRWLLFIWLGALALLQNSAKTGLGAPVYGLFGLLAVSQVALWLMPADKYDGMKVLNAIFILDLNFVICGFWAVNQLQPDLMIALFLGTFMAALSKSLNQSLATTTVLVAIFVAYRMQSPQGFNFNQAGQLLQLPFLFISSVHSSMLAAEAAGELEARHVMSADKTRLSQHMHSTFSEIAHYCKDMSALVDALPFGAIMLDADARVRVLNDVAEEVLGVNATELLAERLESSPRLALLTPYLAKAVDEPLCDFMSVEFPSQDGGSWTLNLGVYPVREDGESRGLLIVLIPQGYGDALKDALPRPVILPAEAGPVLQGTLIRPALNIPGLSLAELGLNYG